jgi:hypothetical protein
MKSNRLMVQEQQKQCTYKRDIQSARKAKTHTKIQLGGLLARTGILDLFNITIGDNLQDDGMNQEKAAGLYGALEDFMQQLPKPLPDELHQRFTNLGIKSFRTAKTNPSKK